MKISIFILFLLMSYSLHAQTDQSRLNRFVSLTGGKSKHGSGDINGVSENISFGKYFRKKISWSFGLGATLHDGSFPITSTQPDGTIIDHSYRYTTGGIQISGAAGYSFIRAKRNEFGLRTSAIVRYQSSSYFDSLVIIFDPKTTDIPYPAIYIFNTSPQKTYSLGISPELFYNHAIGKTFFLGASANFQADTNGDIITNLSLSIGKRFH